MATLANRDWWTVDKHGKPLKVHCVSQNYVLGTARVVTNEGVFAVVDARELHRDPETVTALARRNSEGRVYYVKDEGVREMTPQEEVDQLSEQLAANHAKLQLATETGEGIASLPWFAVDQRVLAKPTDTVFITIRPSGGGEAVAVMVSPANAAFIVRCVNSHTALVEALKATANALVETIHKTYPGYPVEQMMITPDMSVAAALALSEGKELAMDKWQPIETAPRDGTEVLLWWPYWRRRPVIGKWDGSTWVSEVKLYFYGTGSPYPDDSDSDPKNWMPLPAPPEVE